MNQLISIIIITAILATTPGCLRTLEGIYVLGVMSTGYQARSIAKHDEAENAGREAAEAGIPLEPIPEQWEKYEYSYKEGYKGWTEDSENTP